MKKILSLILCLALLCMAGTAFAAETYAPGDEVKVTVDVAKANGAVIAKVRVSADEDAFEFVSAEAKLSGVEPNKNGGAFVVYASDLTSAISGTVGTVTFKIKDDVADGAYEISVSCVDACDTNLKTVSASVSGSTTITVKAGGSAGDRVPGDANEDGFADIFDALIVLQYDAGWEVTINESNADVNQDGFADIFDALLLLQYDAGWDVTLQ